MPNVHTSVINPYALAEVIVGRKIKWNEISNRDDLLANILKTPKEEIFDLRKSPILNPNVEISARGKLKELSPNKAKQRIDAHWKRRVFSPNRNLAYHNLKKGKITEVLSSVAGLAVSGSGTPWNPSDKQWIDKGDYFEDLGEFNDPIQGALGDCYFIAAMSSVAWARPYTIVNMVRPSQWADDSSPIHRVSFYKNGRGSAKNIEVSEKLPVAKNSHNWVFARSLDATETWPAVMEKAYAKWRTGNTTDQPPYSPIAGGDPVMACAQLVRGNRTYKSNSSQTGTKLWDYVRGNSLSRRTVNPMVAWTFSTGPSGTDYNGGNVVGNHAYSVLGWDYHNGTKYIVLRNPWGTKHATVDTRAGTWNAQHTSHWAHVPLNTNGVFSMKASTFKKYFSGIGHVS